MTREEVIIDLNALKFILDNDQYTDEIEEALDTAISALQQPEIIRCEDCKYYEQFIPCVVRTYNGCGVWLDDGNQIEVEPDGFCNYAERKEGD